MAQRVHERRAVHAVPVAGHPLVGVDQTAHLGEVPADQRRPVLHLGHLQRRPGQPGQRYRTGTRGQVRAPGRAGRPTAGVKPGLAGCRGVVTAPFASDLAAAPMVVGQRGPVHTVGGARGGDELEGHVGRVIVWLFSISATTPVTCGAAIDVPVNGPEAGVVSA